MCLCCDFSLYGCLISITYGYLFVSSITLIILFTEYDFNLIMLIGFIIFDIIDIMIIFIYREILCCCLYINNEDINVKQKEDTKINENDTDKEIIKDITPIPSPYEPTLESYINPYEYPKL